MAVEPPQSQELEATFRGHRVARWLKMVQRAVDEDAPYVVLNLPVLKQRPELLLLMVDYATQRGVSVLLDVSRGDISVGGELARLAA